MPEKETQQSEDSSKLENNNFAGVMTRLKKLFFTDQPNKHPDSIHKSSGEKDKAEFLPIVFDIHELNWLDMSPQELLKFMQEKVLEMVLNFNENGQPGMRIEIGRITSIPLLTGHLQAKRADVDDDISKLLKNGKAQETSPLYLERQRVTIQMSQIKLLLSIFRNTLEKGLETWRRPSLIQLLTQAGINAHVKPAELNYYPQRSNIEINLSIVPDHQRETYDFIVIAKKMEPKTVGVFQRIKKVFVR